MSLFQAVELAPRDPILGLNEQFATDPNPAKVNLAKAVAPPAAMAPAQHNIVAAWQACMSSSRTGSSPCLAPGWSHSAIVGPSPG